MVVTSYNHHFSSKNLDSSAFLNILLLGSSLFLDGSKWHNFILVLILLFKTNGISIYFPVLIFSEPQDKRKQQKIAQF